VVGITDGMQRLMFINL